MMTMASVGGPVRQDGLRQMLVGIVVGLMLTLAVALLALWALGYVGRPSAADAYQSRTASEVAEPRPTAAWPFRSEWLTPRSNP